MSVFLESGIVLFFIIAAANGVIGGLIGICGIAGFLLPMLYTGALGYSVDQSLAFSFLAFLVSGILGSINYKKAGNLDIALSVRLGLGSFAGAVAGVFLQSMISKSTAKTLLYLVVLFSGISILFRMWNDGRKGSEKTEKSEKIGKLEEIDKSEKTEKLEVIERMEEAEEDSGLMGKIWFLPLLGAVTGAVCSLSGAGGPVLVMPLLITFGVSARLAVGVALFDSVFIAIPACVGYLSRIDLKGVWPVLLLIIFFHGVGVILGSRMAGKIPVTGLKIFVAIFSVFISIYMLL